MGIQRELHLEWFEHAASVYAAGYSKSDARQEFYSFFDTAAGFTTPPSLQTKTYIANALIKTWISPDKDLISLRNNAHCLLNSNPCSRLAIHWALLCAAYPFWFNVASLVGRLLNLQDQVTQNQVVFRLKEIYGDRQTVSRRARYVIRSFVAWGVLIDSKVRGCYEKPVTLINLDQDLAILMFEAVLYAIPEGKSALALLLNNPACFPFQIPVMTGDFISQRSECIDVARYGLDDELLQLQCNVPVRS